jgi:hypothetical protein
VAVGVKVMVMVQLPPPPASVAGQLSDSAKSAVLVPDFVMLVIVRGPLWLLLRTAVMEALFVPTATDPKFKLLGDTLAGAIVGSIFTFSDFYEQLSRNLRQACPSKQFREEVPMLSKHQHMIFFTERQKEQLRRANSNLRQLNHDVRREFTPNGWSKPRCRQIGLFLGNAATRMTWQPFAPATNPYI